MEGTKIMSSCIQSCIQSCVGEVVVERDTRADAS